MDLYNIINSFESEKNSYEVEELYRRYLWKNWILTEAFKDIKNMDLEQKKEFWPKLNQYKSHIEEQINLLRKSSARDAVEKLDVTRPAYSFKNWTRHPIHIMLKEMINIFEWMGFECIDDEEITTVDYCFDRLRTPERHPSRDTQDTFFLKNSKEFLLRTQTTATQPKILDSKKPPLRIISVWKVYRSDTLDATHTPMFYQLDWFMVWENISVANLKWVLSNFIKMFLPKVEKIRFRPHYFWYTEPSLELDVQCTMCGWKGCKSCKWAWWIEVLGSWMMHQELFTKAWYKWNEFTWFAFWLWIDRLVMQRYWIPDIRFLYDNDMRLLKQITR